MNKKRKHHYIPIGILKNFHENGYLRVYFKKMDEYKSISPNDAFSKRDLNRLENIEGIDEFNGIEDIFDLEYEAPALAVFEKIIKSFNTLPPDPDGLISKDYLRIFNFIKVSIFRTPHVLEYTKSRIEASLYSRLLVLWHKEKGNFDFPDYCNITGGKRYEFLDDDNQIIKQFADLRLCVNLIEDENKQFLLNDGYINIVTPNDNWFQDEKLEIHFAIAPKILISFYRANPNVQNTVWHSMNSTEIDEYNALVIENSFDKIGCKNLDYLKKEIEKNKQLLSVKSKYHCKLDWRKFKMDVIKEIKQYESKCRISGKHNVRLHVDNEFKFKVYSEAEYRRLF